MDEIMLSNLFSSVFLWISSTFIVNTALNVVRCYGIEIVIVLCIFFILKRLSNAEFETKYRVRIYYAWVIFSYLILGYFLWNICISHSSSETTHLAIEFFSGYATFGATSLALFYKPLIRKIYKPELSLEKKVYITNEKTMDDYNPKDKHKYKGFALRLKITNRGRGWAKNVQVSIRSENPEHLTSMNLIWTNRNLYSLDREQKITIGKMYVGLDYYCDLGEILSKDKNLRLATEVKPFSKENWQKEKSERRFVIMLYADNCEPIEQYLCIDYRKWSEYLENMKSDHFLKFDWERKVENITSSTR